LDSDCLIEGLDTKQLFPGTHAVVEYLLE
jgi:hypothetical protein